MNLLLDTHILLWSLLDPTQLKENVFRELENLENELWLSPISTWEILLLSEKGRIHLKSDPFDWLETVFRSIPLHEAPLNHHVALQSRLINVPHQDPADRFIAATAHVYGLTLVTSDSRLIECSDIPILANR